MTSADVAHELNISDQAALDCLERLWRLQLIIPFGGRPHGFKWRRTSSERIASLRFRLTQRGVEKLAWWAERMRPSRRWPL